MKNRYQELSFHSFGFAIITALDEDGSIWACLEKVLPHLSGSGLGLSSWAIWRGLELSAKGLISPWLQARHYSATSASWAGYLSSWSCMGGIGLWVGFYFLIKASRGLEGGINHQASESINLTTVPIVGADHKTSQTVSPDTVLADDPVSSIPISHPRPMRDAAFPLRS